MRVAPMEGINWDLELLPLLDRFLFGLVVWHRRLVVTFGGFFSFSFGVFSFTRLAI